MRLLLAAAELSPYVRTGGLGDAVAGLSGALVDIGHEVTVAIPRYRTLRSAGEKWRPPWWRFAPDGVSVTLFNDDAFDRPGVYGPKPGTAYEDNWERYGRFAKAVAELGDHADLLHVHDAHPGPATLLTAAPTVFTIHNASYRLTGPLQGAADLLGVPPPALEGEGEADYLRAGIGGADRVTTVSPRYAQELLEDDSLGPLLLDLPHPLRGILNGIDVGAWDPSTDFALPAPYDAGHLQPRALSRRELLDRAGLGDGFVLGNVGRMARQKGLDLIDAIVDELVGSGIRLVLVGRGELDDLVDGWTTRHPDAVAHLDYDEALARLVFAGADGYVMPSQFEPGGLGQLYAMRYGCPPIAHLTGGLADSIVDAADDAEAANGFGFDEFSPSALLATIGRAQELHTHAPEEWQRLQRNGMQGDFSWGRRAQEYERIYAEATS